MLLESIPLDLLFQVVEQEATVGEAGQLIFKDQAGRIFAKVLERAEEFCVLHAVSSTVPLRDQPCLSVTYCYVFQYPDVHLCPRRDSGARAEAYSGGLCLMNLLLLI